MKALKLFTLLIPVALLGVSCGTSSRLGGSSAGDDIYYNPTQDAQEQAASASKGKRVPLDKSYNDLINETNNALADTIYVVSESDSTGNPYQMFWPIPTKKQSAIESWVIKTLGMVCHRVLAYSQTLWYATAYDPAFYNIIAMGNTVWAEPKYISSMFGYPYYSSYVNFSPYYSPYRNYWNLSLGIGWGWG